MADALTIQGMIDANADVDTIEKAALEDMIVTARNGREFPSAPRAVRLILEQGTIDAFLFLTKADLDTGNALGSDTPITLVDGDFALVLDDETLNNNGYYKMQSGELTWLNLNASKQALAEIEQAKQDAIDAAAIDASNKTANAKTDILSKVKNAFDTKAQMTASGLPDGSHAQVDSDSVGANNGSYKKIAGVWTKTPYDIQKLINDKTEITIDNMLVNGDFKNGFTGWSQVRSQMSIVNENMIVTMTGAEASGFIRQGFTAVIGNEYLIKTRFKVNSADCLKVEIGNSSKFGSAGYITINNPAQDAWIEVSEIRTATSSTSNDIFIAAWYSSPEVALGKKLEVDYVSLINLTTSFPEGIPNQDVMDTIFTDRPAPYGYGIQDLIKEKLYPNGTNGVLDYIKLTDSDREPVDEVDLYPAVNISVGAIVKPYGKISTASTGYRHTGFIDVGMFDKIILGNFTLNTQGYSFFDADYKVVKFTDTIDSDYVLNGEIEVPVNAKYFSRTLIGSGREQYEFITIKGVYSRSSYEVFALKDNSLSYSDSHKKEMIKTVLSSALVTQLQGEYTSTGVVNVNSDYIHTGLIDISDYEGVELTNFTSVYLDRFWLNASKEIIQSYSYTKDVTKYLLNGWYKKPAGGKYFVANLKNPTTSDLNGIISGERQLNTSDFQRKGSSGDATTGFEIIGDRAKTYKSIDLYNENFPNLKPLRIYNAGQRPNYPYNENYLNFSTEIYREAWGIQMTMNLHKPNYPESLYPTKDVLGANGLAMEWGAEGFSWHVSPPKLDWGTRAFMAFKIGGSGVRTSTKYHFREGTQIQSFVPQWSERTDGTGGDGWLESTNNPSYDETIPTRTNLRHSVEFKSPELYQCAYSSTQNAMWEHYVRCRGTLKAPTAAVNGDSIHRQDFSVATGADADGNPITKKVAQIEIVYADDGTNNEAYIVFKTWNKSTQSWDEKLKL